MRGPLMTVCSLVTIYLLVYICMEDWWTLECSFRLLYWFLPFLTSPSLIYSSCPESFLCLLTWTIQHQDQALTSQDVPLASQLEGVSPLSITPWIIYLCLQLGIMSHPLIIRHLDFFIVPTDYLYCLIDDRVFNNSLLIWVALCRQVCISFG